MAFSLPHKDFDLMTDNASDSDNINRNNTNLSLTEEQRLLNSKSNTWKQNVGTQPGLKHLKKLHDSVHQMTPERVDAELIKRNLSTSGIIGIRRFRLRHHYAQRLKFGCENAIMTVEQPFDYIAVVDFEATCEEQRDNNYQHEIIEFPIVLIDVKQQTIIDRFQSYCRPTIKPVLSKFCTNLTGIKQHQVDNAPTFAEVLQLAERWLNEKNLLSSSNGKKLAFATDGPWDFLNFLQMQCRISSIPFPQWAKKWINIRKEFSEFYCVRRSGIEKMLIKLGLNFDGRKHSGIDDSINIARITLELLKDGCILSLNDSIRASDLLSTVRTNKQRQTSQTKEENDFVMFEN